MENKILNAVIQSLKKRGFVRVGDVVVLGVVNGILIDHISTEELLSELSQYQEWFKVDANWIRITDLGIAELKINE
jgi:hypothetical protein